MISHLQVMRKWASVSAAVERESWPRNRSTQKKESGGLLTHTRPHTIRFDLHTLTCTIVIRCSHSWWKMTRPPWRFRLWLRH